MNKNALLATLLDRMIEYESPNDQRISHMVKVFGFARAIGLLEGLDEQTQFILETAAIVHDIGIKPSMAKYGNADGALQEAEGKVEAEKLLRQLGFEEQTTERVVFLVGHHHTYTDIDGQDYQILVEADFLVNFQEHSMNRETIRALFNKHFVTKTGKEFCTRMYALDRYLNEDYGFI